MPEREPRPCRIGATLRTTDAELLPGFAALHARKGIDHIQVRAIPGKTLRRGRHPRTPPRPRGEPLRPVCLRQPAAPGETHRGGHEPDLRGRRHPRRGYGCRSIGSGLSEPAREEPSDPGVRGAMPGRYPFMVRGDLVLTIPNPGEGITRDHLRERTAGIRSLHGRFPDHPCRNGRKLPGNGGFAPAAQRISPRMADTTYMQTIEISDKAILAHRHGEESVSKTIERKFKQEKPEKESKALQPKFATSLKFLRL